MKANSQLLTRLTVIAGAVVMLVVATSGWAREEIRFYRINKHGQFYKLALTGPTRKPGCHDFIGDRDVNRVMVLGFKHCTIYREESCKKGSEIPAYWKHKRDRKETQLTQGTRWFVDETENVEVSSWQCVK